MQIDLRDQGEKIRRAVGRVLSGAGLPFNPPHGVTFDCLTSHNSKSTHPLLVGRTPGWGRPQKVKFYYANPPRGATFVSWPPPNSQSKYPYLVGWTLQARIGVIPPEIKFYYVNSPWGAFFVYCPPPQFSKHIPPFGVVDSAGQGLGWAPQNKILPGKPASRSIFWFWPPPDS